MMQLHHEKYEEKIGYSRGSLWAPFHAVGMVARIQGDISLQVMQTALLKLQVLYPPLASRVRLAEDGAAWLLTQDVEECPLEIRQKTADEDWAGLFLEQERMPFDFERGPLARFFLLRGDHSADLVIIAPHVVCDGYAVALMMEDALALINDPGREVVRPETPLPANWQTVNHSPADHLLLRGALWAGNQLWPKGRAAMGQERYEEVHRVYWSNRKSGLLAFAISPAEVDGLAARCRKHGVAITGALLAAFLLAQARFREVTVAINIRNRMKQPPGRVLGVFASNVNFSMHTRPGISFWELARESHEQIHRLLKQPSRILWPLVLDELDPAISDTMLAALATGQLARKLGPLARFVKVGGMSPGLDVSNIGRIDVPEDGGDYRLENLLPLPPLWPGGGLAINVLTVNGRLNVVLKYRLDQLDPAAVEQIRDRALGYLADE
jgi:hypothetical protein